MSLAAWMALGIGAASLGGLVWAEAARRPAARAAFKVACSAGFLALALIRGLETPFGRLVFLGLALSAAGDVLLLAEHRRAFLAGLAAFLAGHLAYAAAFAGVSAPSIWTAAALAAAAILVMRWLWPHLGDMRLPVTAYCAAISVMLWLALGVPRGEVRLGALLFYLSDLFVARDRFRTPGTPNRLLGRPLYYAGQYLLALSA